MDKTKVLYLNSSFVKSLPTANEDIDSIYIEGYASTNDVDRSRDVVPTDVWEKGIGNYLKNPIILAYHDHDQPVGKVVEHRIDTKGLWIKVRVSAAAGNVFNLIKDGILSAFSIGFRILDAEYNSATELFIIKELELFEISVVSVPCNQDALFSLSKSGEETNPEDLKLFKSQFIKTDHSTKGLESKADGVKGKTIKEWNMDPKELEALIAKATEDATKKLLEAQAAAKAEEDRKAAEKADMEAKAKAAVEAAIKTVDTGAERLLAEVTKRIEEQAEQGKKALEGLEATIAEKKSELEAIQKSKMQFADKGGDAEITYADKEKAVLLSRITGKSIENTKFGRSLVEKAGPHVASATWELEVSLNMEAEVRRRLVVAPILRGIQMQTNVMTIPVNPEAGSATWVTNAQFGTTNSAGAAQTHQLKEITLNAYKVATTEYMNFEEEEDSLLVLLPVVRDAMVRRVARAVDKAYLMGAGTGSDPVKGLSIYDATSAVTPTNTGKATIANLRDMRRDLGAWGLDPAEITYIVSTDIMYDLLDDTLFQTVDKIGTKATLLTGQIGSIANSPVLVSSELPARAGGANTASTNIGAICVAPANFIAGNQRGLRFDTQDLVETQRKVLVASLRTGLVQLTTNLGQGVSTLRWS